jgi:hypothetical protein
MLGYCPVEKPGGSYHGTAYNILTQTFQTSGTPPDTSACTASQYNTITSDNNVMPSDYNMVKGNGLNIGPFASVFDPGSQLAGGTVYNSETSSAAALCSRASSQCEYFNNPGVNNYCPYSSGTGNYTPQCHFHNGAACGDYGNCNACALCEFTLSIPYYPLQAYSESPNVNNGIYTPPNFSSDNVFSYYNVSPLSIQEWIIFQILLMSLLQMVHRLYKIRELVFQQADGTLTQQKYNITLQATPKSVTIFRME